MNDEMILVDANYNLEDIESFQKYHILHHTAPIKLLVVGAVFLGYFIMTAVTQQGGIIVWDAILYAFILAFIAVYLFRFAPKRTAKKLFETNKLIRDTQKFQIGRESIQISSCNGEARIPWDKLYKAVETKENFVLYISKMQAYIIPKRYLNEAKGEPALLRELMKNAPKPKKEKASRSLLINIFAYGTLFLIVMLFAYFYNR